MFSLVRQNNKTKAALATTSKMKTWRQQWWDEQEREFFWSDPSSSMLRCANAEHIVRGGGQWPLVILNHLNQSYDHHGTHHKDILSIIVDDDIGWKICPIHIRPYHMKTYSHLCGYEITPGTQTETHLMFYPDCFRRFHNGSFYLWPVLLLLIIKITMIGRDALMCWY